MASKPTRGRYWRRIALMFVLIGLLWGLGYWGHRSEVSQAKKNKDQPPSVLNLGLDLQGGLSVALAPKAGQQPDAAALEQAANIIRDRIDALGVAEPDVAVQGDNILIQLPGIKDQQRALELIGTTAKMRFRAVTAVIGSEYKPEKDEKVPDCTNAATWPVDEPSKPIILCAETRDERGALQAKDLWNKLKLGPARLEGNDVTNAQATLLTGQTSWQVDLDLSSAGSKKFETVTGQLACNAQGDPRRQLAIVLDRIIKSHPQMGEEVECNKGIGGGRAVISGAFTERESKDLALVLKFGALPIELERSTTTTISPSLGRDSLNGGLLAGVIGLIAVLIYVFLFYRALGLIIWIGLFLHGAITMGVVVILGQTAGFALSLAGIAGLIVSLGVAADSFIVYFERLKDEVHAGRGVRSAVDRAWSSAWRTIIAADLVTALAAIILYWLAVGSVRGFALMLGIATSLDVLIAAWFMHPAVWLLAQTKRFNESKTLGMRSVAGVSSEPLPVGGGQS